MSMLMQLVAGGSSAPIYVDDVFSTYTYTGSATNIVNGIDLVGKGGTVWAKERGTGSAPANSNHIATTSMGVGQLLTTDTTDAKAGASFVSSFNSNGFTLGSSRANEVGVSCVSWVFRDAPKFHFQSIVNKTAGSNATVDLSTLGTVGMVRVKRTDAAGSWYIWHKDLTAGNLLIGETTAAQSVLGHITVSGTTLTLVNGVIADGTYLVEAWAHDTSATGIIQCGSFTTDGSGNATVTLGFEPQWFEHKSSSGVSAWEIFDYIRGTTADGNVQYLQANSSAAEGAGPGYKINATGFSVTGFGASTTHIYLAIRRPNKPPTSGTQVYNAIVQTSATYGPKNTLGFPIDVLITGARNSFGMPQYVESRLQGVNTTNVDSGSYPYLSTASTNAETAQSWGLTNQWDNTGFFQRALLGNSLVSWAFKRAPGFFDEVCYTNDGTRQTTNHNLTVPVELFILKSRSAASGWVVLGSILGSNDLSLHLTNAASTGFNFTSTNTTFTHDTVGTAGATWVAYLFATLAGISKVGSYTGNGTSQTIPCGFSAGARFILIKRTDSTGNWLVADTVRGITSGNDPSLALNSTAAEVTTLNWVDPYAGGFSVIQEATNNANVNGGTYVFLAIS